MVRVPNRLAGTSHRLNCESG